MPYSSGRLGPRRSRWWRAAAVLLIASAAAVGVWLRDRPSPSTSAGRLDLGSLPTGVDRHHLNVVLVTLDTTRADRIGAYGATDVRTPAFDGLARAGTLFEHAVSVAPLTLPAHSSIFTGKFPPEHGVRDNGGFFLGPEQVTLAEVLKARGYRTGAFVAAYVLDSKWGVDQGFDTYVDDFDLSQSRGISLGSIQRPANEVVDKALPWMAEKSDAPFFAWVHLYDAHSPYRPPEPFATEYKDHPYNGEIAFADSQVGRIVAQLEADGRFDRTLFVVMGDHGESLGDHGEAAHGFFVYDSTTRVPLVVKAPFSLTGERRVADPVRAVDVMPTVLDLLDIPAPAGMSGVTLAPLMTGTKRQLDLDTYSEAMYPLHHYGWSDLHALRAGRYKVIDAPRPELYDLETDPGEATNLYPERQALGDRMIAQLRSMESTFATTTASQPAADVDPEARERLAALGYVGSFVASASDPRTGRADPKDKIDLFNTLGTATELAKDRAAGDDAGFRKVVDLLHAVTAADPQVIDAWFMLGTQYLQHDEPEKAVEQFRHTLQLKPDYDLAVFNMAEAYRRMGNDDAALAGFEHYLTIDPKDPYVRYQMGEIWLDRQDLPRAEAQFRQALAIDPKVAAARNALGVIALQRGDPAEAERLIREALAAKPDVRLAHFNLALLAESKRDVRLAEREYFEELKLHPDSYKSAFNLSRLYEQVGDRDGQIGALKQSIASNPQFAEGHFYLAKAYLDSGTRLDDAAATARKGLALAPRSAFSALGHYVLADVYNRQGRPREAQQEVAQGRALEARFGGTGRTR